MCVAVVVVSVKNVGVICAYRLKPVVLLYSCNSDDGWCIVCACPTTGYLTWLMQENPKLVDEALERELASPAQLWILLFSFSQPVFSHDFAISQLNLVFVCLVLCGNCEKKEVMPSG